MRRAWLFLAGFVAICASPAFAQHACRFYAQNPDTINATDMQNFELEVEIDFTNVGTSTWVNNGGVSNLSYIELRPVGGNGLPFDGPLYHSTWINRQRVGSFLAIQQGVAPQQVARFVFKVQVNGVALGVGSHDYYFRPYHAQGGYIDDWGMTRIRVVITATSPALPPPPPPPPPAPTPNPGPTTLVADIASVSFERTALNSGANTGSYVESYDLVRNGSIPLRRYQTLQLVGSVPNGNAVAHEWSVYQNGVSRLLGTTQSLTTQPYDLFIGQHELRYRVRDGNGNWSSFDSLSLTVEPWPSIFVPVHGSWMRSGNDYNEDDHAGPGGLHAQDWNGTGGGNTDFGLEMIASIPGIVSLGTSSGGGRGVDVEFDDPVLGRFRARYMHLSSVLVRAGQSVQRGQPVGLCGDTGSASVLSHLHYVLQKWINGAWVSVLPEPCFIDDQSIKQVIRYNETVQANTRRMPATLIILPEQVVSAPNQDDWGYGHAKYWAGTVASSQPTASATWDFVIASSGLWKLWSHNPSAVTNNTNGAVTHNSTTGAVFEISRPRMLGLQTYRVDQNNGVKGGLIEVCDMDVQAGDRIFIRQHNATGETGREISFDELVLTLETPAGSGGTGGPGGIPPPSPSSGGSGPTSPPSSPPSNTTGNSGNPPTSQPTYTSPPPPMSGGGGGGGCSLTAEEDGDNHALPLAALLLLIVIISLVRVRRASTPTSS